MVLPGDLIALHEIGETPDDPYLSPTFSDGPPTEAIGLEGGESVLWWGGGNAEAWGAQKWKTTGLTIVVTDRRIVWFTRHFDKGGGWVGFGAVGASVAVAANLVSKRRAKERSAGLVLIGQARFEWITSVAEDHSRGMKIEFYSCLIGVSTRDGSVGVEFTDGHMGGPGVAQWLAHLVRQHRMRYAQLLTSEQLNELADDTPNVKTSKGRISSDTRTWWNFGGDAEARANWERSNLS